VRSRDVGAPRPRELAPQRESRAPLVLEGESRKVGDAILPPSVWQALDLGTNLELVAGTRRRIDVLAADYLSHPKAREQLVRQLPRVEARMSRAPGAEPLVALLERGAIDELVAILLESYYDPLYRHSERGRRYAARFDAENPSRAAREIVRFIDGEITLAAGAG
jgi:tRNA 2-selenouridine synthase